MTAGLHALLAGLIDYAGLFPPARLPLEESIRGFAAHRQTDRSWMLRHFVIPVGQLAKLETMADQVSASGAPWTLSVLTRRCETSDEWLRSLDEDLKTIDAFLTRSRQLASVPVLEIAMPADIDSTADQESVGKLFDTMNRQLVSADCRPGIVFLEAIAATAQPLLADQLGRQRPGDIVTGLKMRTGGLTADDFPTATELAAVIHLCQQHPIVWKATAGLHYALPHREKQIGATMHGFLNVLVAVTLGSAHRLDQDTLSDVLLSEDPKAFAFSDEGLSWRDLSASVVQIEAARQRFLSIGSCSFDEPLAELAKLGYDAALASRPSAGS